jgi:hypothetical protein
VDGKVQRQGNARPAFGVNEAERVYSELERAFKNIDLYVKVRVGDREEDLVSYRDLEELVKP